MEAPVDVGARSAMLSPPQRVVQAAGLDFIPSADGQRVLVFDRDPPPRSIAIVNWKSLLPRQ